MHAKANGIEIHYRTDGREDAPWVTFITGIANDTTMWDGQIAALERDFHILPLRLARPRRHAGDRGRL